MLKDAVGVKLELVAALNRLCDCSPELDGHPAGTFGLQSYGDLVDQPWSQAVAMMDAHQLGRILFQTG